MYKLKIPDWTDTSEWKTVEAFPKKQDAIRWAQEVFNADAKGKIETVFAEDSDTETAFKLLFYDPILDVVHVLKTGSGKLYMAHGAFNYENDFTLRDAAVRVTSILYKDPVYAKSLMDCGSVKGVRVFSMRCTLDKLKEFESPKFISLNTGVLEGLDALEKAIIQKHSNV